MRSTQVTVTDAVTLLVDKDNINRTIYINVVGNKKIALGNSTVTFATGLQIEKHSAPQNFFVPLNERIYAICNTGETDDVRVLLPDAD